MNKDDQTLTKEEKQWIEEAEADIPVEELAISREDEPENRFVSFSKKIVVEVDAINLVVVSFLAFLIAIFLTIISLDENSAILIIITLIFYLVGLIYTLELFKRFKTKD